MKLNELKESQQLDELGLHDIVGDYGSAALKQVGHKLNPWSRGSGQLSVKDKMASDMFVRDFVGRATEDLVRAIKGGQVNPENTLAEPGADATADPYDNGGKTAPAADKPAAPTAPTQPTASAPTKPAAPAKPVQPQGRLPAPQQQQRLSAPVKPGQPAQPTRWHTSQQIQQPKRPGIGYNGKSGDISDANFRMKEGTKFDKLNQIFESILEAGEPDAYAQGNQPEQKSANSYPDTISSYLQKMFRQYTRSRSGKLMQLDPAQEANVKRLADQAERDYNSLNPLKRTGRSAITQLANLAYSLSYSNVPGFKHQKASAAGDALGDVPGAEKVDPLASLRGSGGNAGASAGSASVPGATGSASPVGSTQPPADLAPTSETIINQILKMSGTQVSDDLVEIIKAGLNRLSRLDRATYTRLMKELRGNPSSAKKATASAAPTASAPTAEPTAKPTAAPTKKPSTAVATVKPNPVARKRTGFVNPGRRTRKGGATEPQAFAESRKK